MDDEQMCTGVRKDGGPCRARALPGKAQCFAHDESLRDKRQEAYLKGGQHRATAARITKLMPASLKPVLQLLMGGVTEVHEGLLDPRQATAMASLAGAICKMYETAALEERLSTLEAAHGQQNAS